MYVGKTNALINCAVNAYTCIHMYLTYVGV